MVKEKRLKPKYNNMNIKNKYERQNLIYEDMLKKYQNLI